MPVDQTQAVRATAKIAPSDDEQITAPQATTQYGESQQGSEPTSGADITSSSATKEVSSTRDGSATKGIATNKGAVSESKQTAQLASSTSDEVARITTSTDKEWLDAMSKDMDPANDGWDTELFSEAANEQLKHLGEFIVSDDHSATDAIARLASDRFSCTALRPADREKVFADESITVERPQAYQRDGIHKGKSGLISALEELAAGLEGATDKHFKFKLFRVAPSREQIETISLFELSGRIAGGAIQRTATWRCSWEPHSPDHPPRLLSITLDDYEEAEVRGASQGLFSDCTEDIFRDTQVFNEQFRPDIDYWRDRVESYFGIFYDGLHGEAVGDVNGDGLDDIYISEPGGLPNRLFIQSADGLLQDASAQSGVDLLDSTRTVLLVDLDNDGDQDLVTPMDSKIHFYSNDGKGHFSPEAAIPFDQETALSLAAADYDGDGDIDIYACVYHGSEEKESNRTPAPIPYHDSRTGGFNRLLQNRGNWKFEDVTSAVGLDDNNDRWSFAAVWDDFDNDGDQDIYVSNDFGRNNLYEQDNGRFKDVAGPAGAEDMNFGMSASAGDYNRDGWMDIYVSNMFSSAGGRITYQPGFQTEGTREAIAAFQRMADGNTLLRNLGDGTFRDVTPQAHVGVGRWAWGSLFVDVNNDGWEDVLVANGFVTGDLPGDL